MKKTIELYQTFLTHLERVTLAFAMMLAAVLLLVNAGGIIVEQLMGSSLVWVEEISVLLFAWLVFSGAGAIARRNGHIGVDILHDYLGPRQMSVIKVIFMVLTLIVAWVMVYHGYKMAQFVGRSQTSLYLDISLFYYYLSVPLGGLILGLNAVGAALPGAPEKDDLMDEVEEASI
ncbi:TRAP transporter small permease [Sedimentitalea sp.]|uniref:TRAP transporter small permease n=1 Tax=Sedimentitalea sp. TaxID=2048915 RepID=UPI0032999902